MTVTTVTGLTAAAVQAILDDTIVSGAVVGNELILTQHDGSTLNLGPVFNFDANSRLVWSSSASIGVSAGNPEGVVTAAVGSLTMSTGGGLYYKNAGSGNTGWIRIAPVFVICTSVTRPATPFQGLRIYETDTGKTLMYYGATTGWKPAWYDAWHDTDVKNTPSTVLTSSGTTAIILSTGPVFTPGAANREVEITMIVTITASVASDIFQCEIRNATTGGTVYAQGRHTTAGQQTVSMTVKVSLASGSAITPVFVVSRLSGTGTLGTLSGVNAYWAVKDVGPSSTPPSV